MANNSVKNPSVAVIGAGMTGILMAIKLREAGINDITILEKADKLGGTWRENTYPGVRGTPVDRRLAGARDPRCRYRLRD